MKKSWIKTAVGLALVFVIAVSAWKMPRVVYSVSDRNALKKQQTFHMNLKQFTKDGSIEEQLMNLALCETKEYGYTMKAVKVQEEAQISSDEELTQIIQMELQQLDKVIGEKPNVQTEDLVSRELYTAYITGVTEGGSREGITFWKVRYQQTDSEENEYELEVILDMEYHKIYELKLSSPSVENQCSAYERLSAKKKYKSDIFLEERWEFIELMAEYYGAGEKQYEVSLGVGNVSWNKAESVAETGTDEMVIAESEKGEFCYQLKGNFFYIQDEAEMQLYLNLVKEYGRENEKGYMRLGIANLEAILQI